MKPEEIRIGNLIECNGHPCIVDAILRQGGVSTDGGTGALTEFQPIILTEEWLMKLGCEKEVLDGGPVGYYDSYSIGNYQLTHIFTNTWGIMDIDTIPIKWVHQFQNIYFALTGEELKIQL